MRSKNATPGAALALLLWLWAATAGPWWRRDAPGSPAGSALPPPFLPDVNAAPDRHLVLLPRIGPFRARAIVEERARAGPFASLGELQRVRGIGPFTVAGLQGLARAGPPHPRPREGDP